MSKILNLKRTPLWLYIQEMNEIKRLYNYILEERLANLPRILKKNYLKECHDLIKSYHAILSDSAENEKEEQPK